MDYSSQEDGLKWFGEGLDGFPKRLPDDCVEYIIYVVNDSLESVSTTKDRLNEILKAANNLSKRLLKDYIWQRDGFALRLHLDLAQKDDANSDAKRRQPLPHLKGRTIYGDSVADEWLVVYLLLELSKQFPDAWIRTYDTDGEFLLIEAANALPKWLNPDIAENRVWINKGHLRVMPIDETSSKRYISTDDALNFIRKQPEKFIISPFIEDEAFYRLREYPSAIFYSLHHALSSIPRRLAFVLHRNPAYISPAIEAFYLRDPISAKSLSTKDTSTLQIPPEDFVTVSTTFNKVGYAQLHGQVYDPPPAWTGVIPRMKDPKAAIGMKLACGFEMMLSDPQNQDKRAVREIKLLLDDIESGDEVLPSDAEISSWPQTQDNEDWLNVDYNDFEKELSGKKKKGQANDGTGFGDAHAQENLRKMVSRFEDFLNDDDAGAEGVDDFDNDNDDDADSNSSEGEQSNYNEDDFKQSMSAVQRMGTDAAEESGLLAEARRLALEDAEDQSDVDEDEEMKKVMQLMEQELKGHGALNLNTNNKGPRHTEATTSKPVFGPDRPPHMQVTTPTGASRNNEDDEVGPGDGELSSDDEEFNDVNLGLAKNMLESFKGQAGLAGPAGNLMRAMGVTLPRDDGTGAND